jgi:hypothetical protein
MHHTCKMLQERSARHVRYPQKSEDAPLYPVTHLRCSDLYQGDNVAPGNVESSVTLRHYNAVLPRAAAYGLSWLLRNGSTAFVRVGYRRDEELRLK